MQLNLNQVIEQVGKDKGIDREIIIAALEEAMLTAARKKLGLKEGLEAQYNPEVGEVEIFQYKEVVNELQDPSTQMTLEEGLRLDPDAQVGDLLGIKIDTTEFGRIAAQTAKQVIIQRVKDAERENVYIDYKGSTVSCSALHVEISLLI
jgi:N utilization substance protein A